MAGEPSQRKLAMRSAPAPRWQTSRTRVHETLPPSPASSLPIATPSPAEFDAPVRLASERTSSASTRATDTSRGPRPMRRYGRTLAERRRDHNPGRSFRAPASRPRSESMGPHGWRLPRDRSIRRSRLEFTRPIKRSATRAISPSRVPDGTTQQATLRCLGQSAAPAATSRICGGMSLGTRTPRVPDPSRIAANCGVSGAVDPRRHGARSRMSTGILRVERRGG